MNEHAKRLDSPGPFRVEDIRAGSRYELSDGHPVYCEPTGGDGAHSQIAGAEVLDTDPAVESAGGDAGFALGKGTLRAPDIAVGNVPDEPGWIQGVPPLAVEYASVGQDEEKLQEKIADFLAGGTQAVWVVRLIGPRRVEVYEKGRPVRTLGPGAMLSAPGILRNEVPVEALYDRTLAHELTLRNLLQRKGYEGLEAVREEGRVEALQRAVRDVLQARGFALDASQDAALVACRNPALLERWLRRAAITESVAAMFDLPVEPRG